MHCWNAKQRIAKLPKHAVAIQAEQLDLAVSPSLLGSHHHFILASALQVQYLLDWAIICIPASISLLNEPLAVDTWLISLSKLG